MKSKNLQIYVSTSCLPGSEEIFSRVGTLIKNGFNSIEIGAGVTIDNQNLDIFQLIRKNTRILIHNYFPPPRNSFVLNLASPNVSIRKKSIRLVKRAIALSSEFNAPYYSVHGGFITDPVSFGETSYNFPVPSSPQEYHFAFNRFISAYLHVLDYSRNNGVKIIIENNVCTNDLKEKLLFQNPDEFIELFNKIPSEGSGILLDTGHLNVTAKTFDYNPVNFVDKLSEHIMGIHLHDNDGIQDLHEPVNSDSWIIDILHRPDIAELPIIVEARFQSIDELQKHVNWLNNELGREKSVNPNI